MGSRVSIKDIAKEAGTSHSTVSRALRGSSLISAETREHVKRVAQRMGYTPNAVAQGLKTDRTHTVGLVVTSVADPFYAQFVLGVEAAAEAAGRCVLISSSRGVAEREVASIETFHRHCVDGLLVVASRLGDALMGRLARLDVPVVHVNSESDGPSGGAARQQECSIRNVAVDNRAGARRAVRHLTRRGHQRIGYLGAETRPLTNRHRLEGYRSTLREAGVEPCEDWVVAGAFEEVCPECGDTATADVEEAEALAPRLLEAGVTALFCYNDMAAVGALRACQDNGVRVPEACSIVGFDDIALARYVTPSLTTISQPRRAMGRCAVQTLCRMIENRGDAQDHLLAPALVERESTAPAPS